MADRPKPIILISTPWPLYSRPSIQLGALKAYLKSRFPKLQIKALHLYLKVAERIGYKLYHEISERTWPAESIYAALLFPERINEIKKVFYNSEIDCLTKRYKTLSVAFMDNLVPLRESKEIFSGLHKIGKDLRLFAEIRANTSYEVLKAMRLAGVEEVQIGIEALSTRLLKKFNKGTTCIRNLEVMKHCEKLGIADISNLILCFPGSDIMDVEETLRALDFAFPFRPLRVVNFWLGLESPVWENRHASGLTAVFNHPNYAALFPPDVFQSISFMIQSFKMDRVYQKKLWQPVKKKVKVWEKSYALLHNGLSYSPILSFRDGGDFLIIRQKRPGADPLTHRVSGFCRDIYLFCRTNRSLKRIIADFPQIGEDRIIKFLKMMESKRLIYEENNRYLSLAIKARKGQRQ